MVVGSSAIVAGLLETGALEQGTTHSMKFIATSLFCAGSIIVFVALKMIPVP